MLERAQLHDPDLAAALSRRFIPGPASPYPQRGGHASRLRGASLEFSEHTEYTPGDDLKHLDWKVLAKTDRHYVRRYEDERLSRTLIVLDASNSMTYGGGEGSLVGSKFQLGAQIAVALVSALVRQGDAAGLIVSGPSPLTLSPRPGMAQVEAVLSALSEARPGGDVPVTPACVGAAQRLGSSGTLVVISDFLHEADEALEFLPGLAARGLKARLVATLHADETGLPFSSPLKFVDMETPSTIILDPEGVRKAYQAELKAHFAALSERAAKTGAGLSIVRSGAEAVSRLPALFSGAQGGASPWSG